MDSLSRVICLVLMLLSGSCWATGTVPQIPAGSKTFYKASYYIGGSGASPGIGSTPAAACAAVVGPPSYGAQTFNYSAGGGEFGSCGTTYSDYPSWGTSYVPVVVDHTEAVPAYCPSSSQDKGGGVCACPGTNVPDSAGTSCVAPPSVCAATVGKHLAGELSVPVAGQVVPAAACVDTCAYAYGGGGSTTWTRLGGVWTWVGSGEAFVGTGATCNPAPGVPGSPDTPPDTPQPPLADPPPKGMCMGTVNGTRVAVPCDQNATGSGGPAAPPPPGASGANPGSGSLGDSAGPGSLSPLPKTPAPAGSKAGEKGSGTNCKGDKCDTTDCMIVIQTNGDYVKECSVKGQDKGTFCKENPGSPNCKDSQSSFGGSCSSPVCTGDAIQCAMARDQIARNCATLDAAPADSLAVVASGAGLRPATHPWNSATSISMGGGFDQTDLIGGGCPADLSVQVSHFQPVVLPFSRMCEPARILGNILVGLTALSCLGIVFIRGS